MEFLAKPEDWIQTDEENLAKFLDTETGKRLIPKLLEHCPELLGGGETNAILIRTGEVKSFHKVVETLVLLAHPLAPAAGSTLSAEYPPLEDDAAWKDGQKLMTEEEILKAQGVTPPKK